MIKANARQKEKELFDCTIKLKKLAFDDMTYEQAVKIRQQAQEIYKKQQFFKMLIQQSDNYKEVNNDELNQQQFSR